MMFDEALNRLNRLALGDQPHGVYLCPIPDLKQVESEWEQWLQLWLCLNKSSTAACRSCRSCQLFQDNSHPDLYLPNKDALLTIDGVREGIEFIMKSPVFASRRIWVVAHADRMNRAAMNALLKILEEPPSRAVLLLLAARPHALLPTIRSRCLFLDDWGRDDGTIDRLKQQAGVSKEVATQAYSIARGQYDCALGWIKDEKASKLDQLWLMWNNQKDWMQLQELVEVLTIDELLAGLQYTCYRELMKLSGCKTGLCYELYDYCNRMMRYRVSGVTWNEVSFREQVFLTMTQMRKRHLN